MKVEFGLDAEDNLLLGDVIDGEILAAAADASALQLGAGDTIGPGHWGGTVEANVNQLQRHLSLAGGSL